MNAELVIEVTRLLQMVVASAFALIVLFFVILPLRRAKRTAHKAANDTWKATQQAPRKLWGMLPSRESVQQVPGKVRGAMPTRGQILGWPWNIKKD